MYTSKFWLGGQTLTYFRPDTLEKALDHLADGSICVAAGCTDLLAATERKSLPGPVLDITGIAGLRGIAKQKGGLRIGAATTWMDLQQADLPPALDGLVLAAREVGARQIQHQGTIAGNLCNASPAADGVPPLLTLDAQIELRSAQGTRTIPLASFIKGPRQTAIARNELVTAVHIPEDALGGQGHFLKLGARKYLVISIAMIAVRMEARAGRVDKCAVAIGACGPKAERITELEQHLMGQRLDALDVPGDMVTRALSPIDDARGTAAYRQDSAATLMRRCLSAAAGRL